MTRFTPRALISGEWASGVHWTVGGEVGFRPDLGPLKKGVAFDTTRNWIPISPSSFPQPSPYVDASVSCFFFPASCACLVRINSSTAKTYNRFVLDRRLVTVSMNNKCLGGWFLIAFNLYQYRVECLLLLCDVRKGEKSQQWTRVCLVFGTRGAGLEVVAYLDEHPPPQWARIPKKLAKIQNSTCCLFITFLFAKTSLSSMKKCDFFNLVNF